MSNPKEKVFVKVAECLYRNTSSQTYYAFLKRNGRQIRRSLGTKDRKLAQRRLKEFRGDADKLSKSGRNKMSFRELGETWEPIATANLKQSSADRVKRCLRTLNTFFGDRTVSSISVRDCEEWTVYRGKGIASSTFNKDAQVLKAVFKYAVDRGMLLDNPAAVIKPKRVTDKRVLIPTREQFELLCDTIMGLDPRARESYPLVKLLATSGMRLSEATNIKWGEIDFERDHFVVSGGEVGTKNREVRTVPLFPAMRKFLESTFDTEEMVRDEYLFKFKSARKALDTASRIAGLPRFTHHCLRHFFVSNAIEKGIDFKTIANWIGHKDGGLLVAKTYGHLRDSHSHEMAKLMD